MPPSQEKQLEKPWSALHRYVRANGLITFGITMAVLLVLAIIVQCVRMLFKEDSSQFMRYALAGGTAGFAATAVGAIPVLFLRQVRQSIEDMMLGFAAGMMLAASAFSLLLPGLEAGTNLTGNKMMGVGIVVIGMSLGVLLMLSLDKLVPHQHEKSGAFGHEVERFNRVWLFVFAISLHNLPEGMAIGVGFSRGDMSVGLPLTLAIAIQDIPEGLAVALALKSAGLTPLRSVLIAGATGLLEPVGALLGAGLSSGWALSYPMGLGLAASAMIFVVSHEVIPETHRNGHQTYATIGLMIGFVLMMVLDTALG